MRRALARFLAPVLATACVLVLGLSVASAAAAKTVAVIRIDGGINPAIGDYVKTSLAQAHADGAVALVIELDTPGGLVSTTKDIVTAILNAEIPVVVYVSPRGAWAASAGTFITLAGHVAAMSPGSTIGAAHPVNIGGPNPRPGPSTPGLPTGKPPGEAPAEDERPDDFMNEKVENMTAAFIEAIARERKRNVEWAADAVRRSVAIGADEALAKNVIDLLADDLDDLLAKIHGRVVDVAGNPVTLETEGARIVRIEMGFLNRVFAVIADPQIVGLLFLLGMLGLYLELQNPGLIFPGVLGAICLLIAATALQVIPFNWVGLMLVVGGIALLVAEIYVSSFGLLFALGLAALTWGAWLVFRVPELSDLALPFWQAIFPAVAALGAVFAALAWSVSRAQARPQVWGAEGLATGIGVADSDLSPAGTVLVQSELWQAVADAPVRRGEKVRILSVDGLELRVRRIEPGDASDKEGGT
jgi:membrane-bound serine protease (ClpP class)